MDDWKRYVNEANVRAWVESKGSYILLVQSGAFCVKNERTFHRRRYSSLFQLVRHWWQNGPQDFELFMIAQNHLQSKRLVF